MSIANNPVPLGKLTTTNAAPISLIANFSSNQDYIDLIASYIDVQALPTNTNAIYIGFSGMNLSTLAKVIRVLSPGEWWSVGDQTSLNCYKVSDIYIGVTTDGEGAIASAHVR